MPDSTSGVASPALGNQPNYGGWYPVPDGTCYAQQQTEGWAAAIGAGFLYYDYFGRLGNGSTVHLADEEIRFSASEFLQWSSEIGGASIKCTPNTVPLLRSLGLISSNAQVVASSNAANQNSSDSASARASADPVGNTIDSITNAPANFIGSAAKTLGVVVVVAALAYAAYYAFTSGALKKVVG